MKMKMNWTFKRLLASSFLTLSASQLIHGLALSEIAIPADSVTQDKSVATSLSKLLTEEQKGKPVDRSDELSAVLIDLSKSEQATLPEVMRWQTGELKADGDWVSVEALSEEKLPRNVKNYLKLKDETKLDQAGHRQLAGYCEKNNLKEQAVSHWYGVLAYDPQNEEARKALGFVNFGNRWVSKGEIITAQEAIKASEAACKKWIPILKNWVKDIEGTDNKRRLSAVRELKAVDDPSFVHAARLVAPHVSPSTAAHLVQTVRKFRSQDAAQTLASIAVLNLSSDASRAAIDGLRDLPPESYVPDLLDLMAVETKLQEQMVTQPNGALVLQLVQEREWRNQRSVDWFDKHLWAPLPSLIGRINETTTISASSQNTEHRDGSRTVTSASRQVTKSNMVTPPNPLVVQATRRAANQLVSSVQSQQERENAIIRERQQHISAVLRGATNAQLSKDDAFHWWAWWDQQQESYLAEDKPTHYNYQADTTSPLFTPDQLDVVTSSVNETTSGPPVPRAPRRDCLIAGTLITTESGLVPIENIKIGDRVLSQNIKTGELSLKPVIRTAIRPPAPTNILKLSSGEEIQSTMGHPWWVIGKGWVKSKDLKAGMHLRTPKATVEILEVQPAKVVQTHNIVVADTNSYFVGNDRVLSYDGNELVHTFQRVPGLPADTGKSLASSK